MCETVLDGDDTLRAHLAAAHGLRDDPGTVSHLTDLVDLSPVTPVATAVVRAAVAGHVPGARVYDPTQDDERWRPIVIAFAGMLLLLATVLAVSVG